jgi:hypothetical protein
MEWLRAVLNGLLFRLSLRILVLIVIEAKKRKSRPSSN